MSYENLKIPDERSREKLRRAKRVKQKNTMKKARKSVLGNLKMRGNGNV
jgi:hypothetical protein